MILAVQYRSFEQGRARKMEIEICAPGHLETPVEAARRFAEAIVLRLPSPDRPATADRQGLEQAILAWIRESPEPDLRRGCTRPLEFSCQCPSVVTTPPVGGFVIAPQILSKIEPQRDPADDYNADQDF